MTARAGDGVAISVPRRNYALIMLFFVFALNFLDRQVISILAAPIKAELHLSDTQLGLMGGLAFAILYTCFGIPVSILADRKRRVTIIGLAIMLWSLFTALCGMARGFWSLFLFRVGVGVGESGGVTPGYSMIFDMFPPGKRARATAVFAFGVPVGSALGLLVGGLLGHAVGWRGAFLTIGAIGLVFAPVFLLTVREPPRGTFEKAARDPDAPPASLGETLAVLRSKPSFWLVSFSAGTVSMMSYGLAFWLPSYFQRGPGLSLSHTAQLTAAMTLVGGLIGSPLGGILTDRLGGRNCAWHGYIPGIAALIAIPALIVGMSVDSLPLSVVLLTIPMAQGCLWVPPSVAAMQHLLPARMRATGASIYALIVNMIGLGLGTVLFGVVSDLARSRYGEASLHFSVILGSCVIYPSAALLFFITAKHLPRDWGD